MGNLLRMAGTRSARDRYLSELRSIYGTTTLELPDPDFALLSDPEIYVKMERDPVIYGALDFRLKSVIGQTWHIESASDEPADKNAAALVEEMLSGIKKFQQARLLVFRGALLMGRGYGWLVGGRKQVSQIGGRDVRGAWLPREIKAEDKRRFQYVPTHFEDARGNKRIGQKLQFSPLTLEGQRWIDLTGSDLRALVTMTYEDRADRLGMGQGLGVPLYHWFRQKALAWRDWAQASERWAQGVVAMKINQDREGSDTNQEIADAALDEIDEMRSRHVLIYGEGEEVQLFETSGRGQQISADQIEKIDRDIIRVLTGSVRPMGGDSDTGARAQSETEQDTTDVIIDYDRAQHDEAITETVVRCVWELNTPLFAQFGLGKAKMPRFSTSKDRRQDPQNAVTVIGQALASQIPLRKVDVYEALGMQQPSEDDEVFEGQQPAPGGAPGLPFGGESVASFGEWDEEKHPRDGGKFAPKEGGKKGREDEGETQRIEKASSAAALEQRAEEHDRWVRALAKKVETRPTREVYRKANHGDLMMIKDRVRKQLQIVKGTEKEAAARERFEELGNELAIRREVTRARRRAAAIEEGRKTGKLTIDEGEMAAILSGAGDAYRDAGLKPPFEYNPDQFLTSDLSGRKIRHYVQLPDGRVAHPDELQESRKRGRVIVVEEGAKGATLPPDHPAQKLYDEMLDEQGVTHALSEKAQPIVKDVRSERVARATETGQVFADDPALFALERLAGMTPAERDAELAMYAKKPERCPDGTIMPKSGDCSGHGGAEDEGTTGGEERDEFIRDFLEEALDAREEISGERSFPETGPIAAAQVQALPGSRQAKDTMGTETVKDVSARDGKTYVETEGTRIASQTVKGKTLMKRVLAFEGEMTAEVAKDALDGGEFPSSLVGGYVVGAGGVVSIFVSPEHRGKAGGLKGLHEDMGARGFEVDPHTSKSKEAVIADAKRAWQEKKRDGGAK